MDRETRELWIRFKKMTPEERNDYLQAFFCEACVDDDPEFSITDRSKLFKELIKSFDVSAKFQALKGGDNELFGEPTGGLSKVPRQAGDNTEEGSEGSDQSTPELPSDG